MEKTKKYLKIILGSMLIAITLNLFFVHTSLIPSGIFGFVTLYYDKVGMNYSLILLLINIFFLFLSFLFFDKMKTIKKTLPFFLIPLFTYITKNIYILIDLSNVDMLLLSIYGGILMGVGFRLIYKSNVYVSGTDIITSITSKISMSKKNVTIYILDIAWLIIASILYGIENAMYSLISIIIMELLAKRATIGISDAKVFYIITHKDDEVRDYIINELGYELTIFDVKGGFLKTKNKVLMCAVPTKDYYKLKEGIKLIDENAFISITDSYEVINPNRTISKQNN